MSVQNSTNIVVHILHLADVHKVNCSKFFQTLEKMFMF